MVSQLKHIRKVLVANRGEIAVRCLRACAALGVTAVAIYTEADSTSLHAQIADESVLLKGQNSDGYLNGDEIIEIGREHNVDAVLPGYGFLSENVDFARKVVEAGMVFAGPSPESIEEMGLKHRARELATATDVPVIPGTDLLDTEEDAIRAAETLGFPVMLKATGGGGGMGLQVCYNADEVASSFAKVRGRGQSLFKNEGVFLEKFYPWSHHIEVQVFGNGENVVHFGERECSIQRRHQKVIEECPSPFVRTHPALRAQLTRCAVAYASALRYKSAGTVEFLVDDLTSDFFFLEMNTRLQVEHGITELCYGVDLVALMLRQADEEKAGRHGLPTAELLAMQKDGPDGAALEVRVYAEHPHRDFAPSPGLMQCVQWPEREGVRVDTWVKTGQRIAPYFDPLLAKVMTHGRDRTEAIAMMHDALSGQTLLQGPMNNLDFLDAVISSQPFLEGRTLTNFLETTFKYRPSVVDVLSPGPFTTVQDYPARAGQGHGIPRGGPVDNFTSRIANMIVGNPPGLELLEFTLSGPELQFSTGAVIAVCGPPAPVTMDGEERLMWTRQVIRAGQILRIGALTGGCRGYLAIKGGFPDVASQFNSKSTVPSLSFGGIQGRQLQRSDSIALSKQSQQWADDCTPFELHQRLIPKYSIPIVYVMTGPHDSDEIMTSEDRRMLYTTAWKVGHNSNRSGVRLVGPSPQWAREDGGEAGAHPSNYCDYGYPSLGGMNWGGNSSVIFAMDSPSFGGLICSSTVVSGDMWRLGQLRPGDLVRLKPISFDSAQELSRRVDEHLDQLQAMTRGEEVAVQSLNLDLPILRVTDTNAILKTVESDQSLRPRVIYRQGGDRFLIVEFGHQKAEIMIIARIRQLFEAIQKDNKYNLQFTPQVISLTMEYEPTVIGQAELVEYVHGIESSLESTTHLTFPCRRWELPAVLDHPVLADAVTRYQETIRDKAVYLPDNIEYLRQANGLSTRREVFDMVMATRLLIVSVGFLSGAPVMFPLNPIGLRAQKYNPTRLVTPGGTIGMGGMMYSLYSIEQPGGYMLVGRTLETWDNFGQKPGFGPSKPWLFEPFDLITFREVGLQEYARIEADYRAGRYQWCVTDDIIDVQQIYDLFQAAETDPNVLAYRARQRESGARLAELENRLEAEWKAAVDAKASVERESTALAAHNRASSIAIESPIDANVWKVAVEVGDIMKAGQLVAILEAMKMEINVYASPAQSGARVSAITRKPGSIVSPGEAIILVELGA